MTSFEITRLLGTLREDYDFDIRFAEQGVELDSVIVRSDCERFEIVMDFGEETCSVHFTDADTGTSIKKEEELSELLATIENVTEAVNTLGI